MPSPFPGMDPYLEHPAIWPGVHGKFIYGAADVLSDQLLPKYVVRPDLRVYYSDTDDPGHEVLIPDVRVTLSPLPGRPSRTRRVAAARRAANGSVEPIEVLAPRSEEVTETRLFVKNVATKEVVTVIEFLSPSNKVPSSRGREDYAEKREQVMSSPSHFVEIDLLRGGKRFGPQDGLPPHDYLVKVSRADRRPRATVWPVPLDAPLPVVPIPLLKGDPDATLDLQALLDALYDRSGYDVEIDYAKEPIPKLSPKWKRWADGLLRKKKLR